MAVAWTAQTARPAEKCTSFLTIDTVFGWHGQLASPLPHFICLKCPLGFYTYANISSELWLRKDAITTIADGQLNVWKMQLLWKSSAMWFRHDFCSEFVSLTVCYEYQTNKNKHLFTLRIYCLPWKKHM